MAIPSDITAVVAGTAIAEDWGNDVADAINYLLPGDWENAVFLNSWENHTALAPVQARLEGDVCRIRGAARKQSAGSGGETVFRLSSAMWPPDSVVCTAYGVINGAGTLIRWDISNTGFVSIANPPGGTNNWFTLETTFSVTA